MANPPRVGHHVPERIPVSRYSTSLCCPYSLADRGEFTSRLDRFAAPELFARDEMCLTEALVKIIPV